LSIQYEQESKDAEAK
jgi:hypothetical protein